MRDLRTGWVVAIVGIVAVTLAGTPAHAQVINKQLGRSFNQCASPAPYVYDYEFFTAQGPEAVLTFSRTHIACSDTCQDVPFPPFNSCDQGCSPALPCDHNWKCSCTTSNCFGHCVAGVDVLVGYAVVLKTSRFCSIAACTGTIPLGCPPSSTCDGSGACSDPASNAKALCLCPDPACPIGQHICDSSRPSIPAADLDYEAWGSAVNPAWVLGQATITSDVLGLNGTTNPSSLAQVRFTAVPGENYTILVKWTISPIISGFQSCPDASLLLSLDTRPDSCGP